MLKVEKLNQFYGSSQTLRSVSFDVPTGAVTALLGRNGVGKTTLLKCLMGVLRVASGNIVLDGQEVSGLAPYARVRLGMGYVPQGREIFPRLTVEENLMMGLATHTNGAAKHIPGEIYEMFPVLKTMKNRRGGDLSGGQQQQLAIGRALAAEPRIVLLDEPTEGIQPNIVEQIEQAIVRLNREHGITIVLVEQNVSFARRAAQRFVIMEKGRIAAEGTANELTDELVHRHMAV